MKTEWDYTELANAYLKRPDYSDSAIDAMLSVAGVKKGCTVCDVGAGVAHLTLKLALRGLNVDAVEPNDAMRKNGLKRTERIENIIWHEGVGEETGQANSKYDIVTFGSSFNVCNREKALVEVARILKPKGWFACMWNHRNLYDPIQSKIEEIIKEIIPSYGYGTRREDQSAVIDKSLLFGPVVHVDSVVLHEQKIEECVDAWRSHATLERQAQDKFKYIIEEISKYLLSLDVDKIKIPYTTNIWMARLV
jgi:ubiquinone/menaquinone biosynthesis C-methylase UbiE